jgi:hypothetical protein
MAYKRTSFCGPSGDGPISEFLSLLIAWALKKLKIDVEESCEDHDIDWEDGPHTVDDMRFALNVYEEVRAQKGPFLAGIVSFIGFILVRLTAIVYKLGA